MTKMLLKTFSPSGSLFSGRLLLLLILSFAVARPVAAQSGQSVESPPDVETLLSIHERFTYNVRYGFLNLGEVVVELLPDTTWQGRTVHHMRTVMRSTSRIPFVGRRHVHYQNFFTADREQLYSDLFWRDDLHDEEFDRYKILFDREEEQVYFFERGEAQDTLALEEPASGGDIIFYYARTFAGTGKGFQLPVYISNEKGPVTAIGTTETETREYDAFPDPVETYRMDGEAEIEGPFGFTGRFRAWFSTDHRRIPLEAHVRVMFGNVKIRLISYEKLNERNGPFPTAETR